MKVGDIVRIKATGTICIVTGTPFVGYPLFSGIMLTEDPMGRGTNTFFLLNQCEPYAEPVLIPAPTLFSIGRVARRDGQEVLITDVSDKQFSGVVLNGIGKGVHADHFYKHEWVVSEKACVVQGTGNIFIPGNIVVHKLASPMVLKVIRDINHEAFLGCSFSGAQLVCSKSNYKAL